MEMRFQNRLEKARDYHLRDPIRHRWNAQRTRSAIAFGNLDTTYWRWEVAARCQAIPELVEIRFEALFKLGDRLTIDTSRSPIGLDPFIRIPNVAFGNAERLCTLREVHPVAG